MLRCLCYLRCKLFGHLSVYSVGQSLCLNAFASATARQMSQKMELKARNTYLIRKEGPPRQRRRTFNRTNSMKIIFPQPAHSSDFKIGVDHILFSIKAGTPNQEGAGFSPYFICATRSPSPTPNEDPVFLSTMFSTLLEAQDQWLVGFDVNPLTIKSDPRWPAVLDAVKKIPGIKMDERLDLVAA